MTEPFSFTDFFDTNQPVKIFVKNKQSMSVEWHISDMTRRLYFHSMVVNDMCLVIKDRRNFPLEMYEPRFEHSMVDATGLGLCDINDITYKVFECPTCPDDRIKNNEMAVVQLSNGYDFKVNKSCNPVEVYVEHSTMFPKDSPRLHGVVDF